MVILAQDTTYYELGLYGEPRLVKLLEERLGVVTSSLEPDTPAARLDGIVDSHSGQREDVWIGRTRADAPDIDYVAYITAPGTTAQTPLAGRIIPVEMVAAAGYDLTGSAVG